VILGGFFVFVEPISSAGVYSVSQHKKTLFSSFRDGFGDGGDGIDAVASLFSA
jgi:hypothetical protein